MDRPLLVIAETNEGFLSPLEMRIAQILCETVDIEVISDREYMKTYFSSPRSIDILIISEGLYTNDLTRHNIKKTFVLTEEPKTSGDCSERGGGNGEQVIWLYKYIKLQALVGTILPAEWSDTVPSVKAPQLIAVISAAGGAGCTTVATGLCACLKQNLKRVLYINTQAYQSFQYFLSDTGTLPMDAYSKMRSVSTQVYMELSRYIRKGPFSYLMPLPASRYVLGIPDGFYPAFARAAQKSGEYDDVVVDIGTELSPAVIDNLLEYADKVLIITRQDACSAYKLSVLLHNLSCRNKGKLICNCYDKNAENALISNQYGSKILIDEYVEKIPPENQSNPVTVSGLQKIAYSLI